MATVKLRKPVKRIGLVILLVVIGSIAGATIAAYFYWRQVTRLPDWYSNRAAFVDPMAIDLADAKSRVVQRLTTTRSSTDNTTRSELNETEFNRLVIVAIADNPDYSPLLEGTRGLNTTIENGTLRTGAVINLADISPSELQPDTRRILEQLTDAFPTLVDREVYVGVEGRPQIEDNVLRLDENSIIQVGNLRVPLATLTSQFGISQADLEQGLNLALEIQGVDIRDIEFIDNKAVVSGSVE